MDDLSYKILESYFQSNSLVDNQILSYNDFVTFGIQEIIDQNSTLEVPGYTLKFGPVYLSAPQIIEDDRKVHSLTPMDARLRNLSYDTCVCCDLTEQYYADDIKEEKIHPMVMLGRIPVMLRSCLCNLSKVRPNERVELGECKNDQGGYFIIQGKERVLVAQMRGVYNQVFVSKQKPDKKYLYVAEVRSMSNETGHSVLIQAMIALDERSVMFSLPYIKKPIPVGIVFKAMGFTSEEDIIHLIGCEDVNVRPYLRYILRDAYFCQTQKQALEYIGKFAMHTIPEEEEYKYAWQVVENEVLPHFGISGTLKEQAIFLGGMVRKLLRTYLKSRGDDDKDNYANKRAESTGSLMYELFRNLFKRFITFMEKQLKDRKQRPDILSIIARNRTIITKGFHQCMTSGNWSAQKNGGYVRKGVAQVLDRMTKAATDSHLRRVIIPMGREGKNSAIRQLPGSSFGFISPSETPEGQKVGVVLNLALTAKLTRKVPILQVKEGLKKVKSIVPVESFPLENTFSHTPVYLNGVVYGYTQNPDDTVSEVKSARRTGFIDMEVSVTYDSLDNEVKIFCDDGRFSRPLLRVEGKHTVVEKMGVKKWGEMVQNGSIEYLDASEIENIVIAMEPKNLATGRYDYREIHPTIMFGIMDADIPFPDHTQSPRVCYQSSMGKQALGQTVLSYNQRTDTILHILQYPQQPIVRTVFHKLMNRDKAPSGMNVMVAIASYTGFNQEDSCIMNQSSIDRGLFCLTSYYTIECSEKKRDTYSFEEICHPPQTTETLRPEDPKYFRRKNANYSLLDENGVVVPRMYKVKTPTGYTYAGPCTYVKKGDVIVGKVIVTGNKNGEEKRVDASLVIQHDQEGYIDRVYSTVTPSGYKLIKIVIREWRSPGMGDKVAGRSAQKGTIGMVLRQEDMPFTQSGMVPDIIINPHCIPSRMTLNHLIEVILGNLALHNGEYGDATAFTEDSSTVVDRVSKSLRENGLDPYGWEVMYNGMTGERIESKIFMGSTFYQRLKHMVDDKMHARARGPVTMLTHQPCEGRSRDGGLRLGEMERDALLSHGSSRMVRERLCEVSDPFKVSVCKKCMGITAKTDECHMCRGDNVASVPIPYASKLMLSELNTLGLKIAIDAE